MFFFQIFVNDDGETINLLEIEAPTENIFALIIAKQFWSDDIFTTHLIQDRTINKKVSCGNHSEMKSI